MRLLSLPVAILAVAPALGARMAVAQEETPPLRIPVSLHAGWDTPLGTGGLSVGVESAGGWGAGAGIGFNDAIPGDLHTLAGIHFRAPLLRLGRFDLGALLFLTRGDRERERYGSVVIMSNRSLLKWLWHPAYRVDVAASARVHLGAFAFRVDAGIGYMLNQPRCSWVDAANPTMWLPDTDCANPNIPAEQNATDALGRVAPFVLFAAEYDIAGAFTGAATTPAGRIVDEDGIPVVAATAPFEPVPDARETNAWLAPTALTLPRGKIRLTLYEAVAPEVAIGITDRVQASAGVGFFRSIFAWRGELKVGVVTTGPLRLALLGAGFGIQGDNGFSLSLLGGGAAATVCLDGACRSQLSLAVHAGMATSDGESGGSSEFGVVVSPTLVLALGSRAKLVTEVNVSALDEAIVAVLLRLPFRHFHIELGVLGAAGVVLPAGSLGFSS